MSIATLGEIAEINPKGPKSGSLDPDFPMDFVPMASVLEDGSMTVAEQRPYKEVMKGFTAFKNDDVLLAKITPCFENNKISHSRVTTEYAFGSTEFHVIRCEPKRLDPRYLTYYLRQDRTRATGERRMTGSAGQRRVPKVFLEELQIPLPPLAEQKRIAGILDQADALRRLRHRAVERLNTLGQAIFHEMFGDPKTTQHSRQTHMLGEFSEIKLGKMLDKGKKRGDLIRPYLRNANVRWFAFDLDDISEMQFFETELERFKVEYDDLLVCEGGEPGRAAIWKDRNTEIYYQKALHRIRLDTSMAVPEYLAQWFYIAASSGMLADSVSSATIAHLTGQKIKQLAVMLPPIAEQRKFKSRLEELSLARLKFTAANAKIETLFASLQQRAFRGEL